MLTQKRLQEQMIFDPVTGMLDWRPHTRAYTPERQAGGLNSFGYHRIYIDGQSYVTHKLVWLYVNGYFPKELDHINGQRADNRIENLREVTRSQNSMNRNKVANKFSQYKGVCRHRNKWTAQIKIDGKVKYLGSFDFEEDARDAYIAAAGEHFGEFAKR